MRVIGLIGGMSWESSAEYYRLINESVKRRLGGFHSARLVLYSVDFDEIEAMQADDRWDDAADALAAAAGAVERAGSEVLLLCTNTMHRVADRIEDAVSIPFIHIADPTGQALRQAGIARVGLLGTRYTMEQPFYRDRLAERFGLDVRIPDDAGRELVHRVIYEELVLGVVRDESRAAYRDVIVSLVEQGAEGVILGCTEIGLLVGEADASVPLFDTTRLHAEAAVEFALAGSNER